MSKELYRTKDQKGMDFEFEQVWLLVKDYPKWVDGWTTMKQSTPGMRRTVSMEANMSAMQMPPIGSVSEGINS
jgi:hypothetical protein